MSRYYNVDDSLPTTFTLRHVVFRDGSHPITQASLTCSRMPCRLSCNRGRAELDILNSELGIRSAGAGRLIESANAADFRRRRTVRDLVRDDVVLSSGTWVVKVGTSVLDRSGRDARSRAGSTILPSRSAP